MPAALFGDVTDTDLARATAMLAHYSRREAADHRPTSPRN